MELINKIGEKTKMNTKTIYTRKLAYELRKMGFKILHTDPNPYKPEFDMYIFKDTPEFQEAMKKCLDNIKK